MNSQTPWIEALPVIFALIAGIAVYFKSTVTEHKALVALNVALLTLLVGTFVTFRFKTVPEFERQLSANTSAVTSLNRGLGEDGVLIRGIAATNQKIILRNGNVEAYLEGTRACPQLEDSVRLLASAAKTVADHKSEFLSERFGEVLRDLNQNSSLLAEGRYRIQQSDLLRFSQAYIDRAKKTIVATSYVKPSRWWEGDQGRRYAQKNQEIANRGVSITRYFVFLNQYELNQSKGLLRIQVESGVHTFVVLLDQLSGFNHAKDLILVDDSSGGELELNADREPQSALMTERDDDLAEIRRKLNNLAAVAFPADTIAKSP